MEEKQKKLSKNVILVVALILLVIVSAAQAYQLTSLKSKVSESGISLGSKSSVGSSSSNVAGSQSGLDSLPGMVGGC